MFINTRSLWIPAVLFVSVCYVPFADAQLTDQTQTPNLERDGITKSLSQQIGAGVGNSMTPGSSTYIIMRDPARSIRRGRQLFQRKFTGAQGFGPRARDGIGDIAADAALGAGMIDSCAGCHGRPRGSAGFYWGSSFGRFSSNARCGGKAEGGSYSN